MIHIRLSDHQMSLGTRKAKKEKVDDHKQIFFRSSKKCSANDYKKVLSKSYIS